MPDDLAVGRVQERNSVAPIVEGAIGDTLTIPLGLGQDALWPKGQFLRFYDAKNPAVSTKGIIRRPIGGLELLDSATLVGIEGSVRLERDNTPPRRFQLGINQPLSGQPLRIAL
jgi:hypothetical protein